MKLRNHTLHAVVAAALFAAAPLAFGHSALQQTPPSNTGSEPMMHQQTQNQSNSQMQENRENNENMQNHSMENEDAQENGARSHWKMKGWHSMPGTVTSVNHNTGIVKVRSEGKHLRVHFPPNTITQLKSGDKISLKLGYKMKTSGRMGHM